MTLNGLVSGICASTTDVDEWFSQFFYLYDILVNVALSIERFKPFICNDICSDQLGKDSLSNRFPNPFRSAWWIPAGGLAASNLP